MERYGNGKCAPCQRARMKARRNPDAVIPGRPPRRVRMAPAGGSRADVPQPDTSLFYDPKARLQMLMQRHERTLADFDSQRALLDVRIREAENSGLISDVKAFMAQRLACITDAANYDLKMSKELSIWREFAEADQGDAAPITFVVNGFETARVVVPPPPPVDIDEEPPA